ncbi:MAG: ATP-binding protein, partial [Burkholderiaceae bacterium]
MRLDRRSWLAARFTLAFGLLAAAIVSLVVLAWRSHAELLEAQGFRARSDEMMTTLHRLEAQLQPDVQLVLCAATGVVTSTAAGAPAPAWAATLTRLQAQLGPQSAADPATPEGLATLAAQLRADAQQWQQLYAAPLRRACAERFQLGVAEVHARSAQAEPLRQRIDAGLRGLLQAAQRQRDDGDQRLSERVDASRRSLVLLSMAAVLLGGIALVVVRGFSLRVAEGSRKLFGEAQRRALAQDRLNLSQRRMRVLLDHIPDAVIAFDARGRVQWINPVGEAMFGAPRRVLLGRPMSLLMPGLDEELHWPHTAAQSAVAGEVEEAQEADGGADSDAAMPWSARHMQLEGLRLRGSGQTAERFPIDVSLVQTRAEGHRVGVCVARDLSEVQRVERMKHEFVSMVSHELRTPLTSIHGSLALLAEGGATLEPTVLRLVTLAHDNSERLVALVNDILDFEKLRAGQMRIEVQLLDLNDAAQAAAASCEGMAERRGVQVHVLPCEQALPMATDPLRLNQILLNLLSNAIKFSPVGGDVVLSLERDGAQALATVTDQGPGVPAAFAAHLFEPFAQAANLDTRKQGGTGLGLAI